VLRQQKADGPARRIVAFEMRDRAIGRHGYPVLRDGRPVGVVTSGTQTPFLKKAVGLAMVPADLTPVGTPLTIEIRGRAVAAEVVPEPFYKRPGKA
jgi:aminomethyltransferase